MPPLREEHYYSIIDGKVIKNVPVMADRDGGGISDNIPDLYIIGYEFNLGGITNEIGHITKDYGTALHKLGGISWNGQL